MISRLERAVERAADGNAGGNGNGNTWNNPSGFLSQPKKPDEILALIQVRTVDAVRRAHYLRVETVGRPAISCLVAEKRTVTRTDSLDN